jgi:hypothetical protein
MAVANGKWNFIFLAEPHTASRSVRDALLKLQGSYKAGSHHVPIQALLNYRLLRHCQRSRYTTFCVVRNPADIMVTLWLQSSTYEQGETLAKYIRRWGTKKPDPFFFMHANQADEVIRYENLHEELNQLLQRLQAPSVKLEVVGRTQDKVHWYMYYTPADLKYMLDHFPEIAQWGYASIIQERIT